MRKSSKPSVPSNPILESDVALCQQELAQRQMSHRVMSPSSAPPPLLFRPPVVVLRNRIETPTPASEVTSQQSSDESRKRRAEEQAAPLVGYHPTKQPFS